MVVQAMHRLLLALTTASVAGSIVACGRIGYDEVEGFGGSGRSTSTSDASGQPDGDAGPAFDAGAQDAALDIVGPGLDGARPPGDASDDQGGSGAADVLGDTAALLDSATDAPPARDGSADARPALDGSTDARQDSAIVPGLCDSGQCRRVFLTSSPMPNGGFGGLAGGDAACQSHADARGLGGVWMAWLSDATAEPATRFVHATVPYRLLDGTLVANDWNALISGTLSHAIDMLETGATVAPGAGYEAWTGTTRTGRWISTDCTGWTNGTSSSTAEVGLVGMTDTTWTAGRAERCDRSDILLYCFEQ